MRDVYVRGPSAVEDATKARDAACVASPWAATFARCGLGLKLAGTAGVVVGFCVSTLGFCISLGFLAWLLGKGLEGLGRHKQQCQERTLHVADVALQRTQLQEIYQQNRAILAALQRPAGPSD
jgi:hypothetical protein